MIVVDASAVVDALTLAPATEELRRTLSQKNYMLPNSSTLRWYPRFADWLSAGT